MSNPDMDDFVRRCNEASREAKRAGITSDELAECFMKMAIREFNESPRLQEKYNTFGQFATDTEFRVQEKDRQIRDALDRVEDRFEE